MGSHVTMQNPSSVSRTREKRKKVGREVEMRASMPHKFGGCKGEMIMNMNWYTLTANNHRTRESVVAVVPMPAGDHRPRLYGEILELRITVSIDLRSD